MEIQWRKRRLKSGNCLGYRNKIHLKFTVINKNIDNNYTEDSKI
jgi:hypothetical protein